jgi:hypothetical protein
MGVLVNHRLTTEVATVVVTPIVTLKVFLLYHSFFSWMNSNTANLALNRATHRGN